MLKMKADQNPSTLIPLVKCAAKSMIKALITKENNPNVIIVIGSENSDIIGFTMRLSNPKTIANMMAEVKSATCTPLINLDKR